MIRAWQVKSDSPCGWVAVYPNMTTSLNNGHKSINAVFLQFSSVQGGQHKEAGPLSPRHETWPHNETQQVVRFAVLSASLCQLSSLLFCFCVRLSHELWSFHFSSLSPSSSLDVLWFGRRSIICFWGACLMGLLFSSKFI